MRILCLGAGAIGGYFGGRLIEGGANVDFLVRQARKDQLINDGLKIESSFGNIDVKVRALTAKEVRDQYDLIIITCKAYDLSNAIETITPFVSQNTALLPLLNGVAHIGALNEKFRSDAVLGGVAKIAATLQKNGTIKHLNDWRYITFGEQSGDVSPRVEKLRSLFANTSVVAAAVPNIMEIMWEKVVHLSTVAGMTCTMRASVGEIARTDDGTQLMFRLLERNAEIARREGYPLSQQFMSEYKNLFSDKSSNYTASMLRDIERCGPIEADHIIGYMLQQARKNNIDPSLHEIIYVHLQAYEQRRASNILGA